jgi:hypothetical protein
MKSFLLGCALLTFLAVTCLVRAGHPFICADSYSGKVCVVSADGTTTIRTCGLKEVWACNTNRLFHLPPWT